jgi:hypothetical protein
MNELYPTLHRMLQVARQSSVSRANYKLRKALIPTRSQAGCLLIQFYNNGFSRRASLPITEDFWDNLPYTSSAQTLMQIEGRLIRISQRREVDWRLIHVAMTDIIQSLSAIAIVEFQ